MRQRNLKPLLAAAVLIGAPAVCLPFFPTYGRPLTVFFSVIVLWFAELLPLPATALLVPVLTALWGVIPADEAFGPFGNDIVFLFLGCFLLTRAMQKHGWDKRMAYFVLSRDFSSRSPSHLLLLITACAYTLGMWVSNTATTAIFLAIGLGIIDALKERFSSQEAWSNFSHRLLFGCAFAASIGGSATPVGTPPNLIVLAFLERYGLSISFFGWMARGIPISLAIMTLVLLYLARRYPLHNEQLPGVKEYFADKLTQLGPVKWSELQVAGVFVLMVLLWILPGLFAVALPGAEWVVSFKQTFTIAVVGLGGALLLFLLPCRIGDRLETNLSWHDAAGVDWGTLMLFGGGLCLGRMLEESGLAIFLGEAIFSGTTGPLALIVLAAILVSVLMSEFTSSTAAASIIVPVLIPTFITTLNFSPEAALTIGLACAFAVNLGFMLPVSTPPNALIFGTGLIRLSSMIRNGIVLDLFGIAVVFCWAMLAL